MMISAPSASPSPKSPEVSEKNRKYDRQLRLWGDHGQSKLETSRICLIHANATGTEILKSLVLPGCGSFTIIDSHMVTQEDIGNNFFLDADCFGHNRSECARQLLLELNPEVSGESIDDNVEHVLEQDPNFFNNFTVVIGSELTEKSLILLSKTLWQKQIPFLYCQCVGLIGWIRVQLTEHAVIESHPDNVKDDLRLDIPFPELVNYVNSISLVSREEVIKTPWLVLLFKAVQFHLQENSIIPNLSECSPNGNLMDTSDSSHPCRMPRKEKEAFKEFLRTYLNGLTLEDHDELFYDTVAATNTALTATAISADIQSILDDNDASVPKASKFWVMCSAMKQFVGEHGCLPVRGTLPDMTADSQKYVALQNVYRDKADKDAEDVYNRCQELLRQTHLKGISLKSAEVKLFCKEACNLRLIRGRAIFEELESPPSTLLNELAQNAEDSEDEKIYYVMLRGLLKFHAEYNNYPGALGEYEPDITRFKSILAKMLSTDWNSQVTIKDDYIHEICRYGGSEIPSVAAFIGGCVAQEVIKIVTAQYVPIDNTIIYNAIHSTTSSFTM